MTREERLTLRLDSSVRLTLSARKQRTNPHEKPDHFYFWYTNQYDEDVFLLKKKTVSRCLGCNLFIHFIYMRMYLHVYFICTQGPKMLSEKCCLSLCLSIILYIIVENGAVFLHRPIGQIGRIHTRLLFNISEISS